MKWLQRQKKVPKSKHTERQRMSPWWLGLACGLGVLLGLSLAGGHSQEQPVPRRGRPTAPPPPIQKAPQENDYRYAAQDRRDPLEPLLKDMPPEVLQPKPRDPKRPLEPLERFDMAALKLVGIVSEANRRTGLIKAPDGKSYFALLETYMGKYGGKVIAIENDHLVIEEQYINAEDRVVPKTLTIPLRRKDKKEG